MLRQVLTTAIDSRRRPATLARCTTDGGHHDCRDAVHDHAVTRKPRPSLLEQGADASAGHARPRPVVITAEAEQPVTLSPSLAPLLAPDIALSDALAQAIRPRSRKACSNSAPQLRLRLRPATTPADAAARAAASGAALNLLQEAVQAGPLASSLARGKCLAAGVRRQP